MKEDFNIIQFISKLLMFSPRQGENEVKVAKFITSTLEKYQISYVRHTFINKTPLFKKVMLLADGKEISCRGSSFVSGDIEDKENIISSLVLADSFIHVPNINFNPKSNFISLASMYFAPAIAVNRNDVTKVLKARHIEGKVCVKSYKYESANIFVGNIKSPEVIIFTHYDSIGIGATDNASGVGVTMNIIASYPETLNYVLYVFSGSEELSFDEPTYWGYGYRVFEREYKNLLSNCTKIFVIDSVGNGKANINQDRIMKYLAFPIKYIKNFDHKIFLLHGDQEKLMKVYHSEADTIDQLKYPYLLDAVHLLKAKIR